MKKKNLNVIIVSSAIIMTVIAIIVIVGLCIPEPREVIQGQAETSDYGLLHASCGRVGVFPLLGTFVAVRPPI